MVVLAMPSYIEEAISMFEEHGDVIKHAMVILVTKDLFEVRKEAIPLDEKMQGLISSYCGKATVCIAKGKSGNTNGNCISMHQSVMHQ